MLFQIYGENAGWQLLGWLLVFAGLILAGSTMQNYTRLPRDVLVS